MRALLAALALHATKAAIPTATLKLEGGATLAVAPAALGSLLPPSKAQALHVTLRWAGGLADGCDPGVAKWPSASIRRDGVAVLFFHEARALRLVVHGDDFTAMAQRF